MGVAPGADEQLNPDPSQDHRLPDDLVDGRPVPAEHGSPEVITPIGGYKQGAGLKRSTPTPLG